MSVNLMELLKGAVGNQVLGQLGGLLGQDDQRKTSTMFEGAAASILGGLMNKAGSPDGAKQIFGAVESADDSILDKLGDLLGGGEQTQQVQQGGSGLLNMVFGNQQNGIVAALSKAFGLDKTMIGKLLTLAAPMLLGVLSRHVKSKGLDMIGLGSLLGEQKQHLGNYLPEGMDNVLGLSNLNASAPVPAPAQLSSPAPEAGGGSLAKILIPLLLLGLLAYGAYRVATIDKPAPDPNDPDMQEVEDMELDLNLGGLDASTDLGAAGGIDFSGLGEAGEKLQGLQTQFAGVTDGFQNLTDADGANALKDKLQNLTGSVGEFDMSNASGLVKTSATTMLGGIAQKLRGLVDGVQNESLKAILQPAVDALLNKLESIAG